MTGNDVADANLRHLTKASHRSIAADLGALSSEAAAASALAPFTLSTFPLRAILVQLIWSSAVTTAGYYLSRSATPEPHNSLSKSFWASSRLNVPASLSFGLGWALFVLLSFYLRAASVRHRDARLSLAHLTSALSRVARELVTSYPAPDDRVLAHLVSYPLLLHPLSTTHASHILHPSDYDSLIAGDTRFRILRCGQVVRAYFTAADDDTPDFTGNRDTGSLQGAVVRANISGIVDDIDKHALSLHCIRQFRPAFAYVTHLAVFLCIWLLFVPLSLLAESGWLTAPWSAVITYAVVMVFNISVRLNKPFGPEESELVPLAARAALDILSASATVPATGTSTEEGDFEVPQWLMGVGEKLPTSVSCCTASSSAVSVTNFPGDPAVETWSAGVKRIVREVASDRPRLAVYTCAVAFTAWSAIIITVVYILADGERSPGDRWWTLYLPVSPSVASYLGTVLSTLFAFFLDDAHARFRRALELCIARIKTNLEAFAFQLCVITPLGSVHDGDHARFVSLLASVPLAIKADLRDASRSSLLHELDHLLPKEDLRRIAKCPDPTYDIMSAAHAHIATFDTQYLRIPNAFGTPAGSMLNLVKVFLADVEAATIELRTLREAPVPAPVRLHLKVVTVLWLAFLPTNFVMQHGFLALVFLVPSGYCMLYLLRVGFALDVPFGPGPDDLPIDALCSEVRTALRATFSETIRGPSYYMRAPITSEDTYNSKRFTSVPASVQPRAFFDEGKAPSSKHNLLSRLPRVAPLALTAAVLYASAATAASYALSQLWAGDRQDPCRAWCSPLDVDTPTLANLGLTLFLILAFRAADAVNRFNTGGQVLRSARAELRDLAADCATGFRAGAFHVGDQERITAHIAQVPTALSDLLLSAPVPTPAPLLEDHDAAVYASKNDSEARLLYLLRVVESYILTARTPGREESASVTDATVPSGFSFLVYLRLRSLRATIAQLVTMKNFPFNARFRRHQQVFIALWLALLPLSLTPHTGGFAVLWAPLVTYGLLALETIAARLADPFGTHGNATARVPVADICAAALIDIKDSVETADWKVSTLTTSCCAPRPRKSIFSSGLQVATLVPVNNGELPVEQEFSPLNPPQVPSSALSASIPWVAVFAVAGWAALVVSGTYLTRDVAASTDVRWWVSPLTLPSSSPSYLSFLSFTLLGFYVPAAYARHEAAGALWSARLRPLLHALAAQFRDLFEDGAVHNGDHARVIGHIAALPLALKTELRGSRDLRELSGLLGSADIAAVATARSPPIHVLAVVRAYFVRAAMRPDTLAPGTLAAPLLGVSARDDLLALERIVEQIRAVRWLPLAPAFMTLLDAWLTIWFALLPLALVEQTGPLTVVWVPAIATAVLGLRFAAARAATPFCEGGVDVDGLAQEATADVVHTFRSLSYEEPSIPIGATTPARKMVPAWRVALSPLCTRFSVSIVVWPMTVVGALALIQRVLPVHGDCDPWFCTVLSLPSTAKEALGFALFLILGFRLSDSHGRYATASTLWLGDAVAAAHIMSSRLLSVTYGAGGPAEARRVRDVVCDFAQTQATYLRGFGPLGAPDACVDALRSTMTASERARREHDAQFSMWELVRLHLGMRSFVDPAERSVAIRRVPVPTTYRLQLRAFIGLWVAVLPFALTEATGWLAILWTALMAFGALGVEHWASELEDPFGNDISDIPLDECVADIVAVVDANYNDLKYGLHPLVRSDRGGLDHCKDKNDVLEGSTGQQTLDDLV